eukprot:scaffold67490_cov55-Phaeocystis_antarctica.AAC.2
MTVHGRFLPLSQLELACTALCCKAVPYAPNSITVIPRGARGGTLRDRVHAAMAAAACVSAETPLSTVNSCVSADNAPNMELSQTCVAAADCRGD